jgi:hypothetical protein
METPGVAKLFPKQNDFRRRAAIALAIEVAFEDRSPSDFSAEGTS